MYFIDLWHTRTLRDRKFKQESNEVLLVFGCLVWCCLFLLKHLHPQISNDIKLEYILSEGSLCVFRSVWVVFGYPIYKPFALHWYDYGLWVNCSEDYPPETDESSMLLWSKSIRNLTRRETWRRILEISCRELFFNSVSDPISPNETLWKYFVCTTTTM